MRKRRGFGLVECLVGTVICSMVIASVIGLSRLADLGWMRTSKEEMSKNTLSQCLDRIAPTIRAARRVNTWNSTASYLELVMPKKDGSGMNVVPLQDGNTIAFYLAGTDGRREGTILWRAVNGVTDTQWTKRQGSPRVDLGTKGLAFGYDADNTDRVTISISATKTSGRDTASRSVASTVYVRNLGMK